MSFTPRFTITNAIAAGLTRIERARGFLDATRFSETWLTDMQSRAFLQSVSFMTAIAPLFTKQFKAFEQMIWI